MILAISSYSILQQSEGNETALEIAELFQWWKILSSNHRQTTGPVKQNDKRKRKEEWKWERHLGRRGIIERTVGGSVKRINRLKQDERCCYRRSHLGSRRKRRERGRKKDREFQSVWRITFFCWCSGLEIISIAIPLPRGSHEQITEQSDTDTHSRQTRGNCCLPCFSTYQCPKALWEQVKRSECVYSI